MNSPVGVSRGVNTRITSYFDCLRNSFPWPNCSVPDTYLRHPPSNHELQDAHQTYLNQIAPPGQLRKSQLPGKLSGANILEPFGPRRTPIRIDFRLAGGRGCGGRKKSLTYSKSHGREPTAMIELSLSDRRYIHMARVQSALFVKRENIGVYKCRLCVLGEAAPLTHMEFAPMPAANRCRVKLVLAVGSRKRAGVPRT